MLKHLIAACLTASCLFSGNGYAAEPVNHAAALAPFVSQDSFAVAYADIASLDLPKDKEAILTPQMLRIMQSLPSNDQAKLILAAAAEGFVVRFREAGGRGIYVLAGLGDVHIGGGPVVIATPVPGRRPEEVEQLFGVMIRELAENNPRNRTLYPFLKQLEVKKQGDVVLVGMKGTVARYANTKSAARNDLVAPLERMGREGAGASAVFCPGSDFRRVVRELWPQLPGSLASLRGDLADRWLSLEVAVNSPTDPKPRLRLEARDAESAEAFAKLWQNLPATTAEFDNGQMAAEVMSYVQSLVVTFPAKVEGTHVEIGMSNENGDTSKLTELFSKALDASIEASGRRVRADRFHEIALGLQNYESARRNFPPAAICDKDGHPLLSWRVAILPFIEQQALYKQFHLDEPWDSPHNRTLIEKMPGIYMDLGSQADQLNREGKTTCQVPIGPATVFYNKTGTKYREITDGTANTILVVEVESKRAVPWTKPEDWEVDLKHPRRGVERSDRKQFVAAWCDGSVQYVPVDADETHLRAVLTRAGNEVADSHF